MSSDLQTAQEIRDLINAYADAYDRNDASAYAATFTEDGVLDNSAAALPDAAGREEIAATFKSFRDQQTHTLHLTTNHWLREIGPDRATGQCYFYALSTLAGGGETMMAGRYEDTYVRTPAGWRISRRALVPLLPPRFSGLEGTSA